MHHTSPALTVLMLMRQQALHKHILCFPLIHGTERNRLTGTQETPYKLGVMAISCNNLEDFHLLGWVGNSYP